MTTRIRLSHLLLAGVLSLCSAAPAQQSSPEKVELYHNCGAFPAGRYQLVRQRYSSSERQVNEQRSGTSTMKQVWGYEVMFAPPAGPGHAGSATVTVRRVSIEIAPPDNKPLVYDSAGQAAYNTDILAKQFRYVVGQAARADVTAEGCGRFRGLNAAWDRFAKANPDMPAQVVQRNKAQYGDASLGGLLRLLPKKYLPGGQPSPAEEAGRRPAPVERRPDPNVMRQAEPAASRTAPDPVARPVATLTLGRKWTFTRGLRGAGGQPTEVKHTCTVAALEDGHADIEIRWKVNVMKPQVDGGRVSMAGLDETGAMTFRVHLASGLIVGTERTVSHTDQVARRDASGRMVQKTFRSKDIEKLRLRPMPAAKRPGPRPDGAVDTTDPDSVARAFVRALASGDVAKTVSFIHPDYRAELKRELERGKGLPPVPAQPVVRVRTYRKGKQMLGTFEGNVAAIAKLRMMRVDGRWWVID